MLVHGLSNSTRAWVRNIPELSEGYRLYLVDLPGFGRQSLPKRSLKSRLLRRGHGERGFHLSRTAAWLGDWMEATGVGPAHVIGHSMGGYICLRLAVERPEYVQRLVLVSPAGVPTGRSMTGYVVPLLTTARYTDPRFLNIVAYDALRAGPRTLLRAARDIMQGDVREDLGSVAAPTLLVWGRHDDFVPTVLARALREGIPESRLLMMEGGSHIPMFDRAGEFNEAVMRFFAGETVGR